MPNRPKPPLSPVREAGPLLFISGQLPRQSDGQIVSGCIRTQTEQAIKNLEAQLSSHGLTLSDVVKTTVWLTSAEDSTGFNEVYREYFLPPYPARSTVVSGLVADARVEIEAVAFRG